MFNNMHKTEEVGIAEIQKSTLKAMSNLLKIVWKRVLVEKSMRESTSAKMFTLIGSKDWPEKEQITNKIISIVETQMNEKEILKELKELK